MRLSSPQNIWSHPERRRNEFLASCREHSHKLLERPERPAQCEVERHLVDAGQICKFRMSHSGRLNHNNATYLISSARNDSCRTSPRTRHRCSSSASPTAIPQHIGRRGHPCPWGRRRKSPVSPVMDGEYQSLDSQNSMKPTHLVISSLPLVHLLLD